MRIYSMAWRNVWRNKRRSLVTIGAMSLAFCAMLQTAGLMQGYLASMERNIIDLEIGDIQMHAPGYRDKPSIYERISEPGALISAINRTGLHASARLLAFGLAASEEASAGAQLRGINVAQDRTVSTIYQQLYQGAWLDPSEPDGVVVGRRLARTLELAVGKELLILSQAADGSTANHLYRVRGILRSVSDATDRTAVFMNESAFRDFMVVPEGAHQIVVRRPTAIPLEDATALVEKLAPTYDVKSWRQLMPTFAELLATQGRVVSFMFLIVYFAVGIVILNAMLMAVFERIREFGVLKAIGMGPLTVLSLILFESAYKVAVAVAAGLLVGIPLLWYFVRYGINMGVLAGASIAGMAWDPIWRAEVTSQTFSGPTVMLLVVVLAAVTYPALKAARLRPVDAIRYH